MPKTRTNCASVGCLKLPPSPLPLPLPLASSLTLISFMKSYSREKSALVLPLWSSHVTRRRDWRLAPVAAKLLAALWGGAARRGAACLRQEMKHRRHEPLPRRTCRPYTFLTHSLSVKNGKCLATKTLRCLTFCTSFLTDIAWWQRRAPVSTSRSPALGRYPTFSRQVGAWALTFPSLSFCLLRRLCGWKVSERKIYSEDIETFLFAQDAPRDRRMLHTYISWGFENWWRQAEQVCDDVKLNVSWWRQAEQVWWRQVKQEWDDVHVVWCKTTHVQWREALGVMTWTWDDMNVMTSVACYWVKTNTIFPRNLLQCRTNRKKIVYHSPFQTYSLIVFYSVT